jgi:hypothetical protein
MPLRSAILPQTGRRGGDRALTLRSLDEPDLHQVLLALMAGARGANMVNDRRSAAHYD